MVVLIQPCREGSVISDSIVAIDGRSAAILVFETFAVSLTTMILTTAYDRHIFVFLQEKHSNDFHSIPRGTGNCEARCLLIF